MPPESIAAAIAGALARYESIENLKILLLRAEVAGKELPQKLEELGAIVDDIACYKTVARNGGPQRRRRPPAGRRRGLDHLRQRVRRGELPRPHQPEPIVDTASRASNSPPSAPKPAKPSLALGFAPALEAKEHTIAGLVKALEKAA